MALVKLDKEQLERLSLYCRGVSNLVGVSAIHNSNDELGIGGGHLDKYLLVYYLGQLIERGEITIEVSEDRLDYFNKLLHLDK